MELYSVWTASAVSCAVLATDKCEAPIKHLVSIALHFFVLINSWYVDVRRMNVALTRAKSSLFVLGHAATLERSDQTWRSIVNDARERSHLVDVRLTSKKSNLLANDLSD